MKAVAVSNMAEVLFLLDRHHQITGVAIRESWPNGILELCVSLSGEDIDLDHMNYMRHGGCVLSRLPLAFDAIMTCIWKQEEAALNGRNA